MMLKTILFEAYMASMVMVMGAAVSNGECGAPKPTEEFIAIAKEMALNESMISTSRLDGHPDIFVPVYVHAVSGRENEHPKDQDVHAMITGMAKDYRKMGVHFGLKGIDYTVNVDWSSGKYEMAMKRKLRKGGYRTLNIYYVYSLPSSSPSSLQITGHCYFPTIIFKGQGGDILTQDGCTILRDVLNDGQTTTHEVGHWLGLYHTFEGGCIYCRVKKTSPKTSLKSCLIAVSGSRAG